MTKTVIVLPQLWTGGIQKMNIELASAVNDPDMEVTILSLYPRQGTILEKQADDAGVRVVYLDKKPGFDPGIIPKIARFLRNEKPDVIHINQRMTPYVILPAILTGIKKRMYVIHSMADTDAKGIVRKINRFAFRHLKVQPVAISAVCRKSASDVYGIRESDIPIIYNGVDTEKFKRPEPYKAGGTCTFITACAFRKEKNLPMLARAFKRVHDADPKTELIIVGDGEVREELEKVIEELGAGSCIHLPGRQSDIPSWLHKADVYVCSSDVEGLPVSVLEAMAAALPVASTNAGGVADIIDRGVNGLITETGDEAALADAMLSLSLDPAKRCRMSRESEKKAASYSLKKCAEEYIKLYREL